VGGVPARRVSPGLCFACPRTPTTDERAYVRATDGRHELVCGAASPKDPNVTTRALGGGSIWPQSRSLSILLRGTRGGPGAQEACPSVVTEPRDARRESGRRKDFACSRGRTAQPGPCDVLCAPRRARPRRRARGARGTRALEGPTAGHMAARRRSPVPAGRPRCRGHDRMPPGTPCANAHEVDGIASNRGRHGATSASA